MGKVEDREGEEKKKGEEVGGGMRRGRRCRYYLGSLAVRDLMCV